MAQTISLASKAGRRSRLEPLREAAHNFFVFAVFFPDLYVRELAINLAWVDTRLVEHVHVAFGGIRSALYAGRYI